ncbi:CPBP family intramembrane glutamic endopeptidase [Candidatus Enterococcus ikei]|uniref:CPBP family intramembrane metalloprotease n=1 Tax=Candidatus Enterococcus ikei TaxID=2815326 RepID=A0ABS3GVH8_9ENTE|nr:type II CAAX endopeptidase family protein [Enterococcus sp. DIV0869a]MBO0439249.1 CPBP family intramembrane metalloprotease [Enterococcus sp. DIV0869a]
MAYVKNFFIVVGLFLLSQISMTLFGIAKGFSLGMGEATLTLVASIVLILLVIGNIWLLIFLGKKLGFLTLKFDFLTQKNVGIIVGGFILARIIAIVGTLLLNSQGSESTANDAAIQMMFTGENPLLIVLLIGISAPIMEEIVFRGGIIGFWLKKFPLIGVAVSSIVFGLIHGPTNLVSFLIYASMGLILSMAYYKTQRLEISMSIHFLNNIFGAIAIAFGMI